MMFIRQQTTAAPPEGESKEVGEVKEATEATEATEADGKERGDEGKEATEGSEPNKASSEQRRASRRDTIRNLMGMKEEPNAAAAAAEPSIPQRVIQDNNKKKKGPAPSEPEEEYRGRVITSGWLEKQSAYLGVWNRRFFLLRNPSIDAFEFIYYQKPEYKSPEGDLWEAGGPEVRGSLSLLGAKIEDVVPPSPEGPFPFKISAAPDLTRRGSYFSGSPAATGVTFELRATTEQERSEWMSQLRKAIATLEAKAASSVAK